MSEQPVETGSPADHESHCASEKCHCLVEVMTAFTMDGKMYCCESCARGLGCHHADCQCGGESIIADG